MAALDSFNALPMNQKVGIIAGAGVLIAAVLIYMLYNDLGKLGPDRDNLFSFMLRDTGTGLWNEIGTLEQEIDKFNKKAATLDAKKAELAQITEEIEEARQKLPAAREKSKIGKELGAFAVDVTNENLGYIAVESITIQEKSKTPARGRRKKKSSGPEPQSITFVCQVSTDIEGLIAFINKVERSDKGKNSKRFMTVDGIEVAPGSVEASLEEEQAPALEHAYHRARIDIITWVLP